MTSMKLLNTTYNSTSTPYGVHSSRITISPISRQEDPATSHWHKPPSGCQQPQKDNKTKTNLKAKKASRLSREKQRHNEMQPHGRSRGLYQLRSSAVAMIPTERPPTTIMASKLQRGGRGEGEVSSRKGPCSVLVIDTRSQL